MNNVRYNLLALVAVVSLIIAVCTPHISNPREFLAGMCVVISMICVFGMFWTLIERATLNTLAKLKSFMFKKRATE